MELFTKLNKEEDATILMVTHDPFAQVIVTVLFSLKMESFTMNYTADCTVRNFIKIY